MSCTGENEMVNGKCCHLESVVDTKCGLESSIESPSVMSEIELPNDGTGSHFIKMTGVPESDQSNDVNGTGLNKIYEINDKNPASHSGHLDINLHQRATKAQLSETRHLMMGSDTEIQEPCQSGHLLSVSHTDLSPVTEEVDDASVDVISQCQGSVRDGPGEQVTMVTPQTENALNGHHDTNFQDSISEDTENKENFLTNNTLQNNAYQVLEDIDCDMCVQDMAVKLSVPNETSICPVEQSSNDTIDNQEQTSLIVHDDTINDTSSIPQPHPCHSSADDNEVKVNDSELGTAETDNCLGIVHIPDDTFLGTSVSVAQISPFNSAPDLCERDTFNHITTQSTQCNVMVSVCTGQGSPTESHSECNHVLSVLEPAHPDGATTQNGATDLSVSVNSPVEKLIPSDNSGQSPVQCELVPGINGGEPVTADDSCDIIAHQACVSQEPADNEKEIKNTGANSSHLDTSNISEIKKLHEKVTNKMPLCTDELNHDKQQDSVENEGEVTEVPSQSQINHRTSPGPAETDQAFEMSPREAGNEKVTDVVPGEGDVLPGPPESGTSVHCEVDRMRGDCDTEAETNTVKSAGSQRTQYDGGSTDLGNRKRKKGRAKYKRRLAKAEEAYKCKKQQHLVSVQPMPGYSEKAWTEAHESLTCPVCLDLYYRPHLCRPCGHIFCESCLRRLAKYDSVRERPTVCPICRLIIKDCILDQEMVTQILCFLPDEYSEREHAERNSRFMAHPLPSHREAPVIDLRRLALAVQQRRQQSRARVGREPVPISFWKFLLLVVCFLFLKGTLAVLVFLVCSLFYSTGPLDLAWGTFSKYVVNYKSLNEGEQINLANTSVVVILLIGVLFYCVQKLERGYRINA